MCVFDGVIVNAIVGVVVDKAAQSSALEKDCFCGKCVANWHATGRGDGRCCYCNDNSRNQAGETDSVVFVLVMTLWWLRRVAFVSSKGLLTDLHGFWDVKDIEGVHVLQLGFNWRGSRGHNRWLSLTMPAGRTQSKMTSLLHAHINLSLQDPIGAPGSAHSPTRTTSSKWEL